MMVDKYQRFHASCLRDEEIAPGPGELIVCLSSKIHLEGNHGEPSGRVRLELTPGTILYADVAVPSVRDAIAQHLSGTTIESEVRFGVGVLLGFEPAMRGMKRLSSDHERLIDDWLDNHAIFVFQLLGRDDGLVVEPPPIGLFNGMIRHWEVHWAATNPARPDSKYI